MFKRKAEKTIIDGALKGLKKTGRGLTTAAPTGPLVRRSASAPGALPPRLSIGVDIGGTKVAAGVVDEQGAILERLQEPTPSHSPQAVEDAIVAGGRPSCARGTGCEAVGIGAAGWVDNEQAVVRFSPHLAWRSEPLKARLRRPDRPAADRGQRRQRGGVGGVPVRRRPRRPR